MQSRAISVCIFAAAFVSLSFAQSASPAVASRPAPPAKPVKPKTNPTPAPPKAKYLIEVYPLKRSVTPGVCYAGTLEFPGTNADQIAKGLVEDGYSFEAIPPDHIAIYYKDRLASPPHLAQVKGYIDKLTVGSSQSVTAIKVAHGSAPRTVKQLTLPSDGSLTATAVDESCILIVGKSETPDPVVLAALRKSAPQVYWRSDSNPPTQRLFHLDATFVAKKLSPSSVPDSSAGDANAVKNPAPADPKSPAGTPPKSSPPAQGATQPSSPQTKQPAAGAAPATGDGDGTTGKLDPTDPSKTSDTTKNSPQPEKTTADKSKATPKPVSMTPVNDMLVYSNDDGSDRGFFERNRLMAVLDLPRPEVLMNIWSMQVSTHDPRTASMEAESASELISHNNEALENSIEQGWEFLSKKMKIGDYFEPNFYRYVTQKFVESESYIDAADSAAPALNAGNDGAIGQDARGRWGWCKPEQYCLGFIHAFEPVRPTLTNILLTIMAANQSQEVAKGTIDAMESPSGEFRDDKSFSTPTHACTACDDKDSDVDNSRVNHFDRCMKDELKYLKTLKEQSAIDDCELNDRIWLLSQIGAHKEEALHLRCFAEQSNQSFGPAAGQQSTYSATRVGLLRAAVADFLFNYKWATQYPHDFIPYDLTQSAQELNAEFNPLVLAFNRDVKAFTQNLETELQCKHDANKTSSADPLAWFKKGDETFLNDGMISVRGISGLESVVDTVTQSFFDATNPPTLTDLVKSVSDAEKNIPGVLKTNLTANEAAVLLGALNSVQPAQAKIGRELKLDITPHALAGASSAELEVKLTADESGSPTLFKADKQSEDTLSRVAKHDTNTRVRVESLKLFDVSAFSAMLQRPRSKFPIVPPLFEVPYFGSFIGLPLPGAKVYHRSTAIVSAIIVPTAADLAFGIEFSSDRICGDDIGTSEGSLNCNRANSPYDFGSLALRSFHKAMVQCFASGGSTPYAGKIVAMAQAGNPLGDSLCPRLSLVDPSLNQLTVGPAPRTKSETKVPPN